MLLVILSLVVCSVIAIPLNSQTGDSKIIGGFTALEGQFPYQVSLRLKNNSNVHFCGGSIINNYWILTSASCLIGKNASMVNIVVGSIYLNSEGMNFNSQEFVNHPEYNSLTNVNNIALIRTISIPFSSSKVRSISLSSDSSSLLDLPLTVSGWGLTRYPSTANPNTLQWAITQAMPLENCQTMLPDYPIYDSNICSQPGNKQGVCNGDGGNPLVFNNVQYGISSWYISCGGDYPNVYTKVSMYRTWIKSKTGA